MGEKLWKRTERRIARLLEGERTNKYGERGPDVSTPFYSIEVKSRKELPTWIKDALQTARGHASEKQLGILVLHEEGSRVDLVVMAMPDFRDWFGAVRHKVPDVDL